MSVTLFDIRKVCAKIDYAKCDSAGEPVQTGWVHGVMGNGFYIQHQQLLKDCEQPSHPATWQRGRKWYVSSHMTRSELVQTCLMAVLAFEEHEAREAFLYEGDRLFGPHLNVRALQSIADNREKREHVALSS